jgi:hypothetical protein
MLWGVGGAVRVGGVRDGGAGGVGTGGESDGMVFQFLRLDEVRWIIVIPSVVMVWLIVVVLIKVTGF